MSTVAAAVLVARASLLLVLLRRVCSVGFWLLASGREEQVVRSTGTYTERQHPAATRTMREGRPRRRRRGVWAAAVKPTSACSKIRVR